MQCVPRPEFELATHAHPYLAFSGLFVTLIVAVICLNGSLESYHSSNAKVSRKGINDNPAIQPIRIKEETNSKHDFITFSCSFFYFLCFPLFFMCIVLK